MEVTELEIKMSRTPAFWSYDIQNLPSLTTFTIAQPWIQKDAISMKYLSVDLIVKLSIMMVAVFCQLIFSSALFAQSDGYIAEWAEQQANPSIKTDARISQLVAERQRKIDKSLAGFASAQQQDSSPWLKAEQSKAIEKLRAGQYDILVVPIQVGDVSLDSVARSLMTLSLSQRISSGTSLKVADPVLVAKAFGTTARSISNEKISIVAKAAGVSKVIVGESNHNGNGAWALKLGLYEVGEIGLASTEDKIFEKNNISFDTKNIPYHSFLTFRDEIIETLLPGVTLHKVEQGIEVPVPDVFKRIAVSDQNLAIHTLQLLAVMHPERNIDRARDLLLERSLVLSEYLNSDDVDVKLIRARALLLLNRRGAAMPYLESADSDEISSLRQFALGNLQYDKSSAKEENMSSLMAEILNQRLKLSYDGVPDQSRKDQLLGSYEEWGVLLGYAFDGDYYWSDRSNTGLKWVLDQSDRNPALSYEAFTTRQLVSTVGSPEYEITRMVMEHLDIIGNQKTDVAGLGPLVSDYVDVIRAMAVNNVIERIRHSYRALGKPDVGRDIIDEFEQLLKGQPEFMLMSARALYRLADDQQSPDNSGIRKRARNLILNGYASAGRISSDTLDVSNTIRYYFPELASVPLEKTDQLLFKHDLPAIHVMRSFNRDSAPGLTESECIDSLVLSFYCFINEYKRLVKLPDGGDLAEAMMRELETRYQGHPERLEFIADTYSARGEGYKSDEIFLAAVQGGTDQWAPYQRLAESLIKQSRYGEARDIALRYPGFQAESNAVRMSNLSFEIGSKLFWAGAYQEAKELYKKSAAYNTGSAAGIASDIRLSIIGGDYASAAEGSLYRARRYQSKYALRDLVGLVAVMGDTDWSMNMVEGLLADFNEPEFWMGALVVQRAANMDISDIERWAFSKIEGDRDYKTQDLAMRQLFMASTLDRVVEASVADSLVENNSRAPIIATSRVRHRDGDRMVWPARYFTENSERPVPGSIIKSKLEYAARAIEAIGRKDYTAAYSLLDEASYFYVLDELLPYYAWSAAKIGKTQRIDSYLSNYSNAQKNTDSRELGGDGNDFDVNLSQAFLQSVKGKHDVAMEYLRAANNEVKYTEARYLPTRYQILETARLIYDDTGVDSYRQFALELANRLAVVEPFQAYTHSFVAMLSDDTERRTNALARVVFLDQQSRSLDEADALELEQAKSIAANGFLPVVHDSESGI